MQFKNFQFSKLQFLSGGKFRKTKLHLYRILTHSSAQVPWPTYQHIVCHKIGFLTEPERMQWKRRDHSDKQNISFYGELRQPYAAV